MERGSGGEYPLVPTDKTISTELLRYLEKEKLSISSFANKSGINSGILSRFINGNQPLSVVKALFCRHLKKHLGCKLASVLYRRQFV